MIVEYRPNIPVGIIRFALFVPLGAYQAAARNHKNVIKDHVELQGGIYDPMIWKGEQLAYK